MENGAIYIKQYSNGTKTSQHAQSSTAVKTDTKFEEYEAILVMLLSCKVKIIQDNNRKYKTVAASKVQNFCSTRAVPSSPRSVLQLRRPSNLIEEVFREFQEVDGFWLTPMRPRLFQMHSMFTCFLDVTILWAIVKMDSQSVQQQFYLPLLLLQLNTS